VFYKFIFDVFFRRVDPEAAHHLGMFVIRLLGATGLSSLLKVKSNHPVATMGLKFDSVFGLAAGFDKNAHAIKALGDLGFSHVEIGTVTAIAQNGNEKPRLFRLIEDRALINRMGFNNRGASAAAKRLRRLKSSGRWPSIPVGINIGKSKVTPLENAASDYATSYNLLLPYGDYFVINVSSPNTPGLRSLQDSDSLAQIIRTLKRIHSGKPLLVKIAPDLTNDAVREIAALAESEKLAGLIATNTTLDHSAIPAPADKIGGLSGAPLRQRSTEVIRTLRSATQLPIIASGGIMDAASAKEKLDAGANLVQIYTGFVYHGPELIRDIVGAI